MPPLVTFANASGHEVPKKQELVRLARKILRAEKAPGPVTLIFCENKLIRALNRKFRKLDRVTDVLSFIYADEELLGEIYISVPKAKTQAPRWHNTLHQELKRLVVHGSLHIVGYDHVKPKDRKIMQERESYYLKIR